MEKHRIGILTAGGDCPGLNAVIRAVAKKAIYEYGYEIIGFEDGYEGIIHNRWRELTINDVSGIITSGGTILGTSNSADPYQYTQKIDGQIIRKNVSHEALNNIEKLRIECLVCIGGDGSMSIANRLSSDGIPIIGIPKTIDNDVMGTETTVGFDTALNIATEAIDRIHTSAQSHHRAMVAEVMGRNSGWLALCSGMAGGGDVIIIPEIPYNIETVVKYVIKRSQIGKRFTIIVVSEGSRPIGGEVVIKSIVKHSVEQVRLGGISFDLAQQIEEKTSIETRALVLGHLLRGGTPTATDRILATRLGTEAIDQIRERNFGKMVGIIDNKTVYVPLKEVADRQRKVPNDHLLLKTARSTGVNFGVD